jgi:hypothetical protein
MACNEPQAGAGTRPRHWREQLHAEGKERVASPPIVSGSILKRQLIRAPAPVVLPIHSLWASEFLIRPRFGPKQSRRACRPIQHMGGSCPTTDNGNLKGVLVLTF